LNRIFREIYNKEILVPQQQAASSCNKRLDIVSDPEKANRVLLLLHLVQKFGFSLISFALPSHV
jgi:hypothetical protein